MRLLLDTNVCIAIMNRDSVIRGPLERTAPSQLRMSAITLAELRFGVARSRSGKQAAANLRVLLSRIPVVPFDDAATAEYGPLRADLEGRGVPIDPLDTLIAAHALALRWTLVTHNTREFRRVPGLKLIDWLA
ncbi:MAG: type II toxin-antitoxin system VapC family toxin [Myxococcota bacterium]